MKVKRILQVLVFYLITVGIALTIVVVLKFNRGCDPQPPRYHILTEEEMKIILERRTKDSILKDKPIPHNEDVIPWFLIQTLNNQ